MSTAQSKNVRSSTDMINWLKQKIKEFKCKHDYVRVNRMVMDNYIYTCKKCGKTIHIPL